MLLLLLLLLMPLLLKSWPYEISSSHLQTCLLGFPMVCWLCFVLAALDFLALHALLCMALLREIFKTLLLLWLCSVKSSKDGM